MEREVLKIDQSIVLLIDTEMKIATNLKILMIIVFMDQSKNQCRMLINSLVRFQRKEK